MAGILEQAGAQPQKQPRFASLFMDRAFTGLFTQRSVLHDPSDVATAKFYGGRPDALWSGVNVELTNRLTLQRRPGLTPFSLAAYPTAPNRSYPFELTDGTIRVIVDGGSSPNFVITSVAASVGTTAVYTGVITGGASGAYINSTVQVSGFVGANNNGIYACSGSSATTLTLVNSQATVESSVVATAFTPGSVYWDQQNGNLTQVFAKYPGSGQTTFVGVAGILYMGDGIDNRVYTPKNLNGQNWKFGIDAPTVAPTVVSTLSGIAATAWRANTMFTTMGILVDSVGNVQQLIGVNADGSNPSSQFGLAGSGAPAWSQTIGVTTTEGSGTPIVWTNQGTVSTWAAGTRYTNFSSTPTLISPCFCYDPVTNMVYGNSNGSNRAGISQSANSGKPNFNGVLGSFTNDNGGDNGTGIKWVCLGTTLLWIPSTAYKKYGAAGDNPNGMIVEPAALPPSTTQSTFVQVSGTVGTSGTGGTAPPWPTVLGTFGALTVDGQLLWLSLGSATRVPGATYIPWVSGATTFSVIKDNVGNLQVCTAATGPASGATNASLNGTWATAYGSNSPQDGGVTWTCVGTSLSWVASTIWYLPADGFAPSEPSQTYGGAEVIEGSPAYVQTVINSGKSGATAPSPWSGLNLPTTDNTVTWYNVAAQSPNSLAWSSGYVYAYSFKARALTDAYSPLPLGGGLIPPPLFPALTPGGPLTGSSLGPPVGSEIGSISSASPVFTIIGGNQGSVNLVSGLGSLDIQVDTIVIWRSADGGGSANMFELTEIPAPQPIGGVAQTWKFNDYLPDVPTTLNPGLNNLIPAPIDDVNDPPPLGFLPMVYNFERIWGAVGNTGVFSGGPDTEAGNPNTAYNPTNIIPFLANITRMAKSPAGLVTFLTDAIDLIGGGPSTDSFYDLTLGQGIGLSSFNALDVYAGEIFFFSSDSQLMMISPSLQIAASGFPIGDKLALWDASKVYIAVQQAGTDNCIMVADGSTGWYRMNPRQVPGGFQGVEPIWSPFAAITGGCKMVQSVEVSPGIKKLLVGSTIVGQEILERNTAVFTDNGMQYDANFVMGSIMLAHPGQIAALKFLEMDFSGVGYQPTVSFLMNEIAGTFTPFTLDPQFDPPSLYGKTITPTSYSPNRYYFSGTQAVARCRHCQLKIDFGVTPNGDEIFNLSIVGRILVET